MKTKLIVLFVFALFLNDAIAQTTIRSGKVLFDITYPDSKLDENTKASLPTESVMYFKDDLSKVEVSMGMAKTSVISDNKTGNGTMLLDMGGAKYAIEIGKEDADKLKSESGKPTVEVTSETKKIAGYNCKKAIVTMKTKEADHKVDIWFTKELAAKNSYASQIDGIDGFMLEFFTYQNGLGMKMTAKSIEPVELAAKDFEIPEGYEKHTMDYLKNFGIR